MRYPKSHKFLAWAGPATFIFTGSCVGLVAALAQSYPGVKSWGQGQFDQWWPIVTTPWFLVASVVVIAAYIFALVWAGRDRKAEPPSHSEFPPFARRAFPSQPANRAKLLAMMGPDFDTLEDRVDRQKAEKAERRRQARITDAELKRERQIALVKQRRAVIVACRDMAHRYLEVRGSKNFATFIRNERAYLDIEPHLGAEYREEAKRDSGRSVVITGDGSSYGRSVFLKEIARLEKEWNLA